MYICVYIYIYIYIYIYSSDTFHRLTDGVGTNSVFTEGPYVLYVYVCIYIYIHTCLYIYIYIYTHTRIYVVIIVLIVSNSNSHNSNSNSNSTMNLHVAICCLNAHVLPLVATCCPQCAIVCNMLHTCSCESSLGIIRGDCGTFATTLFVPTPSGSRCDLVLGLA